MIFVNSIIIHPESITIKKGKWYHEAYAEVLPTNATCRCVTWHSNNSNVASVSQNGYIYGMSEGSAVIYAVAQDGSGVVGFCNVTVVAPIKVSAITVTPLTQNVNIGETFTVSATVYPSNADNKGINWTSNDENIAEVNTYTRTVTAKSVGTTYICANARDGSDVSGHCTVTVSPPLSLKKLFVNPRNGSSAEIKRTASSSGETVCFISAGAFVNLIETEPSNGKWYKIHWQDANGDHFVGWCSGENLQSKKTLIEVEYEKGLFLRRTPSQAEEDKINSLMKGAIAWLLEEDKISNGGHDYYKVHYDNMDGYVTADDDEDFSIHEIWAYLASNITITQPITNISVTAPNLVIGETLSLDLSITPNNATDTDIDWISCDESIAIVNSIGEVTGINVGNAIIVAAARDGSQVIGYFTIEVAEPESIKELRIQSSSSTTVAIKKNPSNSSETVGHIENNTIVDLIGEVPQNTKWYKIFWNNPNGSDIYGWCSGEYLHEKVLFGFLRDDDNWKVRSSPSTTASNYGTLKRGSLVKILDEICEDGTWWYKVIFNGETGYVPKYDYAEPNNSNYDGTTENFKLYDFWQALIGAQAPTVITTASQNCKNFIKNYEQFLDTVTIDPISGDRTIGYGHVLKGAENYTTITEKEALDLFDGDIKSAETLITNYSINRGALWNQQEFDAFVSLAFNVGSEQSLVMDNVLSGTNPYDAFAALSYSGGMFYLGLYRRRMDEADIFVKGEYEREERPYPN